MKSRCLWCYKTVKKTYFVATGEKRMAGVCKECKEYAETTRGMELINL